MARFQSGLTAGDFYMNARHKEYRLSVDLRQVNDAVSCIFHSLMLHRSVAKFDYRSENNYTLGSIGIKEVDCDDIDLTYVRVNSSELAARVDEEVCALADDVQRAARLQPRRGATAKEAVLSTCVALEFYQKRRRHWPLSDENVSWEVWNIYLDIYRVHSEDEMSRMRESVAERLGEVVLSMCADVNRPQYLPKMPTRSDLANIFDTSLSDCQPYLYKITRPSIVPGQVNKTETSIATVRQILKDTLSF